MSENITKPGSNEASEEHVDELIRARPPIEIGLMVAGRFSLSERRLLQDVEARFKHVLELRLPEFDWRIAISRRRDIGERGREESTELLRRATEERDLYRWDYAIVIVNDELLAYYRSFALAVLSRPLDAAVISTARLIPDAEGPGADDDQTPESEVVDRITTVMLRCIAHLGGLKASKDPSSLLYRPESPDDLSRMQVLTPAELEELKDNLSEVADLRLEESSKTRQAAWRFLLRATLINREQILETIVAARPWQFPRRLSRLTTAAVSTVALLLMSAESWDLGLSQSWTSLACISLFILTLTTVYISFRQHLFALAILAAALLFSPELISQWTNSAEASVHVITPTSYLKMATFCASVGLLIGALGASFEEQTHFQHVIFVDDEL